MSDIYPAEAWPSESDVSKLDGTTDQATGLPYIAKGTGPTSDPPLEIQYNRAQQRLKTILSPWNQGRVVNEGGGKIGVYPIDYWMDDQMQHFTGATGVSVPGEGSWVVYVDRDGQLQVAMYWPADGSSYLPLAIVYLSGGQVSVNDVRPYAAFRISRDPLLWPLVADLNISVGAESNDQIDVTIQVVDAAGSALAEVFEVHCWLADSAYGEETAAGPDGGVSVVTGTLLVAETPGKRWRLISDSGGQVGLRLSESGAATWYLNGQIGGRVVASGAITFS